MVCDAPALRSAVGDCTEVEASFDAVTGNGHVEVVQRGAGIAVRLRDGLFFSRGVLVLFCSYV